MFILPLERDNPLHSRSLVVYGLVAVNTLVFAVGLFGSSSQIVKQFGFTAASPHITTLFSNMFLHGGFLHLLGNMFFLWMFGDNVEDVLGHTTFAVVYLLSGFGAVLGQYLSGPQSRIPMVGASGAISGVMAMYIIFFPAAEFDLHVYLGWWRVATKQATSKTAVFAWFLEQVVLGALTSMTHAIGIAFWAHVGGFVAGGLLGAILMACGYKSRYDARVAARRPSQRPRHAVAGANH